MYPKIDDVIDAVKAGEDVKLLILSHLIDENTIRDTASELYYQSGGSDVFEYLPEEEQLEYKNQVYKVINPLVRWLYNEDEE
jgi:trehalose utilization protein